MLLHNDKSKCTMNKTVNFQVYDDRMSSNLDNIIELLFS